MRFDIAFLVAAIGRIHHYNIKAVIFCVIQYVVQKAVVVVYARHINIVQKQVGYAHAYKEIAFFLCRK